MQFWLPVRQSRWLYCLRWLQNGCAVLALWHVDWPNAIRLTALLIILLYARRQTPPPRTILFDSYGLQLFYPDKRYLARLGAQCYCSEFLIVLCIYLEQDLRGRAGISKRWLLLLPDSSDRDALRKLRIYLRWRAQTSTY